MGVLVLGGDHYCCGYRYMLLVKNHTGGGYVVGVVPLYNIISY